MTLVDKLERRAKELDLQGGYLRGLRAGDDRELFEQAARTIKDLNARFWAYAARSQRDRGGVW